MKRIFLSGACRHLPIEERNSWRQWFEDAVRYTDVDLQMFNPNKKFCYEKDGLTNEKTIMNYFLYQLERCDVVVVNLKATSLSPGTAMEVMKAVDCGLFIIGFGENEDTYEYIRDCCDVVLKTKEDAWDFIIHNFL